jgi:hypothetical protein
MSDAYEGAWVRLSDNITVLDHYDWELIEDFKEAADEAIAAGHAQALAEIRDRGDVIISRDSIAAAIELIQDHWAGYGDESDVGRQAYDDLLEARDRDV